MFLVINICLFRRFIYLLIVLSLFEIRIKVSFNPYFLWKLFESSMLTTSCWKRPSVSESARGWPNSMERCSACSWATTKSFHPICRRTRARTSNVYSPPSSWIVTGPRPRTTATAGISGATASSSAWSDTSPRIRSTEFLSARHRYSFRSHWPAPRWRSFSVTWALRSMSRPSSD